jgi:hypothetical protein
MEDGFTGLDGNINNRDRPVIPKSLWNAEKIRRNTTEVLQVKIVSNHQHQASL